ncbi:MAG: DUF4149 domain-containing protein [Verrucomicrobia bacterium]|nr:DUF4149 domain-containing protein [Verrucomicrobiota bacterium]
MHAFIRFVGVVNAAVWVGALVFFTVAAGPAFFSSEMLEFLPRPYAGRAAEVVIGRLFTLQQWCAGLALLHLAAEYLYAGRAVNRFVVTGLATLFALNLLGGYWLLPHMHSLQQRRYSASLAEPDRAAAARSFALWHGTTQAVNLLMMAWLLYYLWHLTREPTGARLVGRGMDRFPVKLRS